MWIGLALFAFFVIMFVLAIAICHAGAVADKRLEEYYRDQENRK